MEKKVVGRRKEKMRQMLMMKVHCGEWSTKICDNASEAGEYVPGRESADGSECSPKRWQKLESLIYLAKIEGCRVWRSGAQSSS